MDNTRPNRIEQRNEHEAYCALVLNKIAAAANVELSAATITVYLEFLIPLTNEQLGRAQYRTIADWTEPSKMPPISFIIERSYREPGDEDGRISTEILARPDKPADWKPIATDSAMDKLVPRGVSHAEVLQWLEEGKQKQRQHIAQLEADPAWRKMAAQFGAKVGKSPEELAAERNGVSQVPAGPDERRSWARQKALDQGWTA